jgi:hypothetical protein
MRNKKIVTPEEIQSFSERLKSRPELYEQFSKIMDLSDCDGVGSKLDINLLEGALMPVIRETGRLAVKEFAEGMEEHVAKEVKESEGAQQREKKR